jgi:uncharacterized protein YjdB
MNKIVCDLCGTSYPETAPQCPICGTAKTTATKSASGSDTGYAYVKGGRFSHANVKKRNAGNKELPRVVAPVKPQKPAPQPKAPKEPKEPKQPKTTATPMPAAQQPAPRRQTAPRQPQKEKGRGTNILLAAIALLLVIAILAVFAYLVKGFLDDRKPTEPPATTTSPTTATDLKIPCRGVSLALNNKTFSSAADKFYLSVTLDPQDTTDVVWYESSDERIATVDEKGIVYPVADGIAIITVHCGDFTAECSITVEIGKAPENPTDPTDPTDPTEPTGPVVELVLNRTEFTLTGYGDYWDLYTDGKIDVTTIVWSSSDEAIAKVENGRVTAMGNGIAVITAEYMGQVATCTVHCTKVEVSNYELQTRYGAAKDFTLKVGDTITLFMVDSETGIRVPAENLLFALSKEGVITIDENGKIKAVAKGTVTVTVTYGEISLKCKVRVTAA